MINKCHICCIIRLLTNFFQLMLFVLVFCLLPTKGDYEKVQMDYQLDEIIKINQTIFGFSIILFVYIYFFYDISIL